MKPKLSLPAAFAVFACTLTAPAAAQVAVTEFLNNPEGDDTIREFFELYNFSADPVNIINWTIADEDSNSIILSDLDRVIPSGGYLVFSVDKAQMETDYFGGLAQLNIIQYDGSGTGFQLANGGDEIVLSDAEGDPIWSVAYANDDVSGRATFLSENDFSTTVWGSKATPGIDRAGVDPATGTIGYESNNATEDPNVTTTAAGDTASPLSGFYTVDGGGGPVTPAGFKILSILPGTVSGTYDITFESELNRIYDLERSTDLSEFGSLGLFVGTGPETTITVPPLEGSTSVYYRLRTGTIVVDP